jgi:glutathione synthase/RimK-type ligase-like ATP-grasp enzyme
MAKCSQSLRMDAAGIPVPKWTVIMPETRLDPATWGPYVVEKPEAGRVGAFVRIRRTGRVRYAPPDSYPAQHHGRKGPMIVQRFIYTGERPTSYRVFTFFGETLLCYRQWSLHGYPLASRWDFKSTGGISIVSNVKDMKVALDNDEEVIALAERTHREAFDEFPLLSVDIVRDADTGELFVLEAHTRGGWMFSRPDGLSIQADNKINFESQFDGIEKAAQILARETPRLAAVSWPLRRSPTPSLSATAFR